MRRRTAVTVLTMLGAALVAAAQAPGAPPTATTARVSHVATTHEVGIFPVTDAAGRKVRDARWRLTDGGGNCCEAYVATTPRGKLLDFGGTYPVFSDDGGMTWNEVRPTLLGLGGEGAISAAPDGDIVGVGWDTYSGDRLQAFLYDAETDTWSHNESPLHHPLFDRPWIAVVPGPFTLADGTTAPYATVVRSNYLSSLYDMFYVSYDGLTYLPSTDEDVVRRGVPADAYLEPSASPMLDYLQPHPGMRVTPLAGGGMLNISPSWRTTACPSTRFSASGTWSCLTVPGHRFEGHVVVDSKGWLHEVVQIDQSRYRYAQSTNGGRTWSATTLVLPEGGTLVNNLMLDYKVSGALGRAVVAVHAGFAERSQDFVYRIDTSSGRPKLLEMFAVGRGDRLTGRGVTETGARFDFASVAMLPDGRIMVAFDDGGAPEPRIAIELPDQASCAKRCPR